MLARRPLKHHRGRWAGGPYLNREENAGAPHLDFEMWECAKGAPSRISHPRKFR